MGLRESPRARLALLGIPNKRSATELPLYWPEKVYVPRPFPLLRRMVE